MFLIKQTLAILKKLFYRSFANFYKTATYLFLILDIEVYFVDGCTRNLKKNPQKTHKYHKLYFYKRLYKCLVQHLCFINNNKILIKDAKFDLKSFALYVVEIAITCAVLQHKYPRKIE